MAGTFGEMLQARRNAVGCSQAELAVAMGVDRATVSTWENDARKPQPTARRKLDAFIAGDITLARDPSGAWRLVPADPGTDASDTLDSAVLPHAVRSLRLAQKLTRNDLNDALQTQEIAEELEHGLYRPTPQENPQLHAWLRGELVPARNAAGRCMFVEPAPRPAVARSAPARTSGPGLHRPDLPQRALDALTATLLEYEATFGPSEAHARLTADLRARVQAGALSLASAERLMSALDWTIAEARGVPPPLPPADHVVATPPDVRERLTPALQPVVGELAEAAQRMLDLARAAGWAGVGATARAPGVGAIHAVGGDAALRVDPGASGQESSSEEERKKSVSGVVPPSDSGFSQIGPVGNSGEANERAFSGLRSPQSALRLSPMLNTIASKIEPVAAEGGRLQVGLTLTPDLHAYMESEAKRLGIDKSAFTRWLLRVYREESAKNEPDKG